MVSIWMEFFKLVRVPRNKQGDDVSVSDFRQFSKDMYLPWKQEKKHATVNKTNNNYSFLLYLNYFHC
jgi:hypothetical protein